MHRRRPEGFLFQPNYIPFDAGGRGEAGWTRNKISLIHKNSRSVSRLSFCPREIKIPARGGRIIDNVGTRAGFPRSNFSFSFFFSFSFSFEPTAKNALLILNLILSLLINFKNSISIYFAKCKRKKRKNISSKKIRSNVLTNVSANFQPERAMGTRRSCLGRRSSPSFFKRMNRFRSSRDEF